MHRLGYVDPTALDGINPVFHRFAGRLAIPNINGAGVIVQIKFRSLLPDDEHKYDQLALPNRLFNLAAVPRAHDTIAVCEGEFDVITCTQLGIPAVGVPGATAWKQHCYRLFTGYDRVVVFADQDEAGERLLSTIMKSGLPVQPAAPPGGHNDLNDALQDGLGEQIRKVFEG